MIKKVCCSCEKKHLTLVGIGGALIGFAVGMIADRAVRIAAQKIADSIKIELSDLDDLEFDNIWDKCACEVCDEDEPAEKQ